MNLNTILTQIETLALIAAVVVAGVAMRSCQDAKDQVAAAEWKAGQQKQINESTVGELAATRARADTLSALVQASHDIHGKLVAGLKIKVSARDTLVLHDTVTTVLQPDSTRIAQFADSTFAGSIHGTVTAPPCCQPLSIQYQIRRPAFEPSVGFVQVGNRQVAVVAWQGERVELEAPFSKLQTPPKRLTPYAEASVDPALAWTVGGGAAVRLGWGVSAFGRLEQRMVLGEHLQARAGFRKEW